MPRRVSRDELARSTGSPSEPSAWLRIDQDRIDAFADATGDRQWIHVDPARATATPFGATIAHGFLTLSLLPHLLEEITPLPEGTVMGINYGLDRVRFLQPVTVGSEVRARAITRAVTEKEPGRVLVSAEVTVEIRGLEKPALVAETLTLFVVAPDSGGESS
jgi:acyl dehydratase